MPVFPHRHSAIRSRLVLLCLATSCHSSAPAPAPGASERVLHLGDRELHAVEWPGNGIPLVMLHGLGGNAVWWSGMAQQLGHRHVIALDLPGHGNSELPPSWEPDALARDVLAAVRRRWPGEHIWVGHSWGGKIAVAAAAADSSTRGVILIDAVPASEFRLPDPAQTAADLFAGELDPWPSLDSALAAVRKLPQYSPWTPAVELAFRRGVSVQPDGRVVPHLSRVKATTILRSLAMDLSPAAAAIHAPVLILSAPEGWFDEDQQALFPSATFVRLNGNHWLQISNVDGSAATVLGWLRTHAL